MPLIDSTADSSQQMGLSCYDIKIPCDGNGRALTECPCEQLPEKVLHHMPEKSSVFPMNFIIKEQTIAQMSVLKAE